jgi:membrane protein implicated in regulation of membrane protease activity
MNDYIFWAIAIVVFTVLEAATAQLVSVWFIVGSIAAFISVFFGAPFYLQAIVFVVVSIITLIITRPLVKKYVKPKGERTNADRVLEQPGIVIEKIDNDAPTGQVRAADGQLWSARSTDGSVIEEGAQVTVKRIEGVKLIVAENK